jgi:hypothetical protein
MHQRIHSKKSDMVRCKNPEISARILEFCVLEMIRNIMTDPYKLQKYLNHAKDKGQITRIKTEKQLNHIEDQIQKFNKEKRGVLEIYAKGNLSRNLYAQKCLGYDNEINRAKAERNDLIKQIPILHKNGVIDMSIKRYCQSVKARLEKCVNFDSKRQFLLDYVEKIIYQKDHITLYGSIPIKLKAYEDPDQPSKASKIGFSIGSKIDRTKILRSRNITEIMSVNEF